MIYLVPIVLVGDCQEVTDNYNLVTGSVLK